MAPAKSSSINQILTECLRYIRYFSGAEHRRNRTRNPILMWLAFVCVCVSVCVSVEEMEEMIKKVTAYISCQIYAMKGFPRWLSGKESTCQAGDSGSLPGSGRSPGEGNGNPLQNACLENPMDRGAWWATVHGVAKSRTQFRD